MTTLKRIRMAQRDVAAHRDATLREAFRSGADVIHVGCCPEPNKIVWMYRRRPLSTFRCGSNAGGGSGWNVGGVGIDGRLYERDVYDCKTGGNPPRDYARDPDAAAYADLPRL